MVLVFNQMEIVQETVLLFLLVVLDFSVVLMVLVNRSALQVKMDVRIIKFVVLIVPVFLLSLIVPLLLYSSQLLILLSHLQQVCLICQIHVLHHVHIAVMMDIVH